MIRPAFSRGRPESHLPGIGMAASGQKRTWKDRPLASNGNALVRVSLGCRRLRTRIDQYNVFAAGEVQPLEDLVNFLKL